MQKIFRVSEFDYVVAETMEQACKELSDHLGLGDDDSDWWGDSRELRDDELDSLMFTDGDPEASAKKRAKYSSRTFREQLKLMVERGDGFPCMFATSDAG